MDVPPGVHKLVVKAPGYDQFERQVVITAGQPSSVKIDMQLSGGGAGGAGPCEQYGPAYNQDNLCFDSRPVPLASTLLPTPNDQALDLAKGLHWNPAQKNGEPVDAWVQWPFKPVPLR